MSDLPALPLTRQPSRDDEFDVLRLDGAEDNESPEERAAAASADSLQPPPHPRACHVRVRSSAPDAPPPPGALTGRAHQRYDGDRRIVCGCVPFRVDDYTTSSADGSSDSTACGASASAGTPRGVVLSVLLVRSKKRDEFIFAKGGQESFECRSECARRETLEEAGVEGVLLCALPAVDFASKKQRLSRMHPFLMQVTRSHARWAEQDTRRRRWTRLEDVAGLLGRAETRAVWAHALRELQQRGYVDAEGKAAFFLPPPDEQQAAKLLQAIDAQDDQPTQQRQQHEQQPPPADNAALEPPSSAAAAAL